MKYNGQLKPDFARTPQTVSRFACVSRPLAPLERSHVLGALAALLARYTNDPAVTLALHGKSAVTVDVSGDPTFSEIVKRLSETASNDDPDCHLSFQLTGDSLICHYDAALYRAGTMEALLGHFQALLEHVQQRPHLRLSEFSFLSAEETHRLLVELNDTAAEYPRHLPINALIEVTAELSPDAIAAQFQDRTLTYAELDSKANQLAHTLADQGAGPGARVGICLDRSLEMLIAVLAVLKTGAAYVPLDPGFPAERLQLMAGDAAIRVLVTSQGLQGKITTNALTILVDRLDASAPTISVGRSIDPESIAYLLYTSGSTGKPKGVEVPHRAVVNLLHGMQAHVQLEPHESLLAVTTLSFDIAMLELFLPLCTGARVIIASRAQAADPRALQALLQQTGPDVMQATPVTWRMLVESGWGGSRKLRVLIGGERVTREMADALLQRCATVWNVYGPTETTIWSTICRLEAGTEPISIGRPLANTTLYVLDQNLRLSPTSVPGELYIGGDGLARGYCNQPELTARCFIANPFGPGGLYRTGDLVRYLPDGRLEILGRNDSQVKIRGFRIELGDVESALAACPQVSAAAAVVQETPDGECILHGYVAPQTDVAALRAMLANRLPDYMVPTHLISLDALPLTPNGKIDRKALTLPATAAQGVVTNDSLEARLIDIWESTLGIRPIAVGENFFDLGGNSVLAARIFARMEKELGKTLPLATLFQAPTIGLLAAMIRTSEWKPMWSSLVPIRPAGTKPPFFFVHPIGGNVLNFSGFCSHFDADQPIYGLQARGLDGEETPHTSVEEMAADYITSVRAVQPEGPYYIGGFSAGGAVAFEMAQQLRAAAQPVGMLALLDTEILTLSRDPVPARARLHHWWRMTKANLRYATHMRAGEFLEKKSFNLRMRRKLFTWSLRERLRLPIDAASLNAEEAFLLAFRRYQPKPYFGDATLFRAGDGAEYLDPQLGWSTIIRGRLNIQEVSGDHDTILQEPNIGMLARLLETYLAKANQFDVLQPALAPSQAAEARAANAPTLSPVETWGRALGGKP